jgi:hypothetical protein
VHFYIFPAEGATLWRAALGELHGAKVVAAVGELARKRAPSGAGQNMQQAIINANGSKRDMILRSKIAMHTV